MMQKKSLFIPLTHLKYFIGVAAIGIMLTIAGTGWSYYFWRHTTLSWQEVGNLQKLFFLSDLGSEDNLGAWFSSMLLLSTAAMALICFVADQNVARWLRAGWLLTAFVFAGLSFSEMGSIHERLPSYLNTLFDLDYFVWVVWLGPMILAIPIFMSGFAWLRLRRIPLAFGLTLMGILLLSSIPVQEIVEVGILSKAMGEGWQRPILHLLLEEGTELAGMYCFLLAFSVAAYRLARRSQAGKPAITITIGSSPWAFLITVGMAAAVLAIGTAAMSDFLPKDALSGTPTNWPPSAFAFSVGIVSFFLSTRSRPAVEKAALVATGLSLIAISAISAATRIGILEEGRALAIALLLCGSLLFVIAGQRHHALSAILMFSALVVFVAPNWKAENHLLLCSVLIGCSLLLREGAYAADDIGGNDNPLVEKPL
jgi:hypothetical protein